MPAEQGAGSRFSWYGLEPLFYRSFASRTFGSSREPVSTMLLRAQDGSLIRLVLDRLVLDAKSLKLIGVKRLEAAPIP